MRRCFDRLARRALALVGALVLAAIGASTAEAQITATVSWDPNPDSYTVGYRLYYGTEPGTYDTSVDAGSAVSVPITLSLGSVYYFVVRAYNLQGTLGPASAEAQVDLRTPAPTAQITATLGANNVATVTWQTANAVSATLNGSSVALSGTRTLTVTATTTFALTATAADGRTATASATVTVSTGAPGAPRSMAASVSGSRVTLRWLAPSTGGTPTHYLIYVGTRSGYSDITNGYNVGNVLSFQGDLPKGSYYARVRAANASGTSLNSNEVRFNVGRKLQSPSGVTVTWTGTTATFSWVSSSADIEADMPTNYVLEAGTAPGESNVATLNVGNTTAFTTEVPSGTYYVRIRAQNAEGDSDPSREIEVRLPGTPPRPTGLVSMSASGVLDLRWTASAGGYAPTGYIVEAGSGPGLSDLAIL